ncbi:potassium transporter 7 isoform X2 [Amborella trichopoda]|nr:potassium transporter 7 isoform X2 [Amborella trichopoda]|eukprot:XP_020520097.1 potassium transporter 7 isoform X2 [Amborella trichopoda]
MLGTGMVIVDGVLTPAISVLSAVSGIRVKANLHEGLVLAIACLVLVGLFALQHFGTRKVAFMFAPVVILWLLSIGAIGLYNVVSWNPRVLRAISPCYMFHFLRMTGKDGVVSLGGILLCISGAEAMHADLGHFSRFSIKVAFLGLVYPCLVLAYMGEAAFLTKHPESIHMSFYNSIPESVFWPAFLTATLASVVGSQAVISATFSVVQQCAALDCFPRVRVVHTSKLIYGQIYIPEVNWILMLLCLAVTLGFQDTLSIGHAYGISVISIMFITTCLMAIVIKASWKKPFCVAMAFLLFFGSIELLYLFASLMKVPQGGWFTLLLSSIFLVLMYVWHYGKSKKYEFDLHNKVPMETLLGLGPSLGIVRVPGIGLIYTELPDDVPPIFAHFMTNLPAFHKVLVVVCLRSIHVPTVPTTQRYLISRIGTKDYKMFRCIVRYGYTDIILEDEDFENQLVLNIAEFMWKEAELEEAALVCACAASGDSTVKMVMSESKELGDEDNGVEILRRRKRRVRFELPKGCEPVDAMVEKELVELSQAKEVGVVYILENSCIQAKKDSNLLKKIAIDFVYAFLRRNCRAPAFTLNVPCMSRIEAGTVYYV